ncbi:hypothetical protein AAG570_008888 [Ranatra chinensis]|uniref:Nuclear pore complex protein NUP96 C-terminal domain-containing protein n=1 Tax=Ranatra chinensis TaxID=642074 RepID=A0ABD0YS97_9HEMI
MGISFSTHRYVCPLSSSVTDALLLYEKAFRGEGEHSEPYAASPLPSYSKTHIAESFSGVPIYDILYHLLRLFSYKSHPLEQLLNPATYSIDPLDYRLRSFADQLESHDLWEWAVFVLLHIPEPNGRAHTVQAIISRHITVDEDCEKESFLIEQLQIPVKWIYESKATRAIFIMEHIASRAIINENYEFLEEMLEALEREDHWKQVSGWQNGGCVILEYLGIIHEVEDIVKKQDPMVGSHLVRLKPVLTDLCSRIKLLPVRSPIDRFVGIIRSFFLFFQKYVLNF